MPTTVLLVAAAAYLVFIGSAMKVTSGGIRGVVMYKTLPIALSFGLVLVAFK